LSIFGGIFEQATNFLIFIVEIFNQYLIFDSEVYIIENVVIPLITSLISNPNTPFEQDKLHPCSLSCLYGHFKGF
jgi:hypothetical protein